MVELGLVVLMAESNENKANFSFQLELVLGFDDNSSLRVKTALLQPRNM